MRIHHYFLFCLALTGSSYAFACGVGYALGLALVYTNMLALIVGLIAGIFAGILCRVSPRCTPWKSLVALSIFAIAAAFAFPFVRMVLPHVAIASLPMFASIAYLVRGGLFQPRFVKPSPTSINGKPQNPRQTTIACVIRWIAGTYVFWAVASFANPELLFFLAFPPAVLHYAKTIEKFMPFILPPLVVALAVGVIVTVFLARISRASRYVAPLVFNICVLLTFLASAEVFRYHMMSKSLLEHKPNHLRSSPFLTSILNYNECFRLPHASFDEDGKTFRWSYSERKFVQVP